ncbi:conjugal transfer protein TraG, partial [Ventosimonas gracilis]
KDIQAAGLLPTHQKGKEADPLVYVGGFVDKDGTFYYLRHSGPEHILCYAPTRSGKGVGLVVPSLLAWTKSAVITDLKGELWALTAGWRQQRALNKVLRFEPASSDDGVVRWNPLDEIRFDDKTGLFDVGDVQNLATLIVDPDGKGLDTHWQKTACALLVGVILHALYLKRADLKFKANIAAIDAMLSSPDGTPAELWDAMINNRHNPGGLRNDIVASAGADMKNRPQEEGGSVLSTAKSYLALYRDPVVEKNTNCSDFLIKDLMHHESPVSLYIVTQPNDKARLRPLVRILVNMIVRLLADKMEFKNGRPQAHYKHRLLMMLDEFPSLGKLDILQESLAFVAGYGIKCYLICQDINQLKSRETGYGQDESITSNCHIQNAYPPNRIETAEHLSKLSGQTTAVKAQITTSGKRGGLIMGQVSKTFQEVQRPLLTPDEALRMAGPKKNAAGEIEVAGDMVIYAAGYPAIYGRQLLYFKDPVLQKRAAIVAPARSDTLRTPKEDPVAQGQVNALSGEALCNA